jgi:adenosine kinase
VTTFFGCVGNDKYAKILADKAQSDGVNTQYQTTDSEPTGTCAVLVTGTKRSLVANLGAANKFTESHIHEPDYFKYLELAEFYYISGFFLTVSPPSILTVAKYAHDHNRLFMMNLSAPFITEFFSEPLMAAMPYIDILFGNEAESLAFAKKQNFGTEDLREIGRQIVRLPKANPNRKRVVIITQGGKHPVLLFDQDTIREFEVVELTGDAVKDTNGAGDAFVGGFLAQLLQKQSFDNCIRCGIQAAVEIIKRSGCTFDGQFCFDL